jgi:uncharacterized membrane protein YoaK (UPF0700 family)
MKSIFAGAITGFLSLLVTALVQQEYLTAFSFLAATFIIYCLYRDYVRNVDPVLIVNEVERTAPSASTDEPAPSATLDTSAGVPTEVDV